jgi:flagellar biosynthesis protein FlhG
MSNSHHTVDEWFTPGDQADGLRRLFAAGRRQFLVPVAYNAHVDCMPVLLERLAGAFTELGANTLVIDAADSAPRANAVAEVDLPAAIEKLSENMAYLAARGLPLRHVNSRGSCEAWLGAVEQAAPQADVLLLHANARDLVRLLGRRAVRPILTTTLDPASLTDAYTSMKLLAQRSGLLTFDLLTGMAGTPKAAQRIAERLADTADSFLGAVVREAVWLDKREPLDAPATPALARLAANQLIDPDDFAQSGLSALDSGHAPLGAPASHAY